MTKTEEFKERTRKFALRIMRLCRALPKDDEGRVIARQLLRSGTSVGANYRAVSRARSRAEFIAKLGIVVEEMDETIYWLGLIEDGKLLPEKSLKEIKVEANELMAIVAASQLTAKGINRQ